MNRREYEKQWKLNNKERVRELARTWYLNNRARHNFSQAKARAKRNGIPFDLTFDELVFPNECPVLGIPLFFKQGAGPGPNSPSFDRIDPSKGYVQGNVQVISHRANVMKNDASKEELRKFAEWINRSLPS